MSRLVWPGASSWPSSAVSRAPPCRGQLLKRSSGRLVGQGVLGVFWDFPYAYDSGTRVRHIVIAYGVVVLIGRLLIEMLFLLGSITVNCLDSLAFSFRALASCGLAAVSSFAVSTVIVLWAAYFF